MFGRSKTSSQGPGAPAALVNWGYIHAGDWDHVRADDYRRWKEEELSASGRVRLKAQRKQHELPVARSIRCCPKCGDSNLKRNLTWKVFAWESIEFVDGSGNVRGGTQLPGEAEALQVLCPCGYSAGLERPLDADL